MNPQFAERRPSQNTVSSSAPNSAFNSPTRSSAAATPRTSVVSVEITPPPDSARVTHEFPLPQHHHSNARNVDMSFHDPSVRIGITLGNLIIMLVHLYFIQLKEDIFSDHARCA